MGAAGKNNSAHNDAAGALKQAAQHQQLETWAELGKSRLQQKQHNPVH